MTACWRRYSRKESLDQRPIDFTTSKGTPLNKYSRVAPIQMPWPLMDSMPSCEAARLSLLRNSFLVRGRSPLGCRQANKGWSCGGLLTARWLARAANGSAAASCEDQKTSSHSPAVLVCGNLKTVTGRPLRSWTLRTSKGLMWRDGRNAFREGTVNSPSLATEKNVVVRQEKTEASRGFEGSNLVAKELMVTIIKGDRLGLLEEGGARMVAPSRAAFISMAFICQGAPWRVCQARIA